MLTPGQGLLLNPSAQGFCSSVFVRKIQYAGTVAAVGCHSKREALKLFPSPNLWTLYVAEITRSQLNPALCCELSWQAQTPPAVLLCQHGHLHRPANPTAWLAKSVYADLSGTPTLVL